jgi:predicted RecA/RadA family phage recombinase
MRKSVLKPLAVALLLGGATVSATSVKAFPVPKTIGQAYQGGIVFYVDLDGMHGLIAARADQGAAVTWSNVNGTNQNYRIIGAI